MNRTIEMTLSVSSLVVCIFLFGCRSNWGTHRNPTIEELAYSLMYEEVLSRLQGRQWELETDPGTIMTYCDALVETKRPLGQEIVSPSVPRHVSKFVRGYYSFRQGKLKESLKTFSELAQDKEHHLWGDLGILEFSLVTGSISNMKRPLESFEKEARKTPSVARQWNLPYYKAWYSFYSGQYDEVDRILNEYKDSLDIPELTYLKVRALLRQDRFNEAQEIIGKMPPQYQWTAESEADLIKLKYGSKRYFEFLSDKRKEYPKFWGIESRYADALVDLEEIDAATEVRKKLVQERPFDFFMHLAFAAHQLYHGNLEEAKAYLIQLDYPPEVNDYDVLMSEVYRKQDMNMKAWEYLWLARKMFPKSVYVLSTIMGLAFEERDFDKQYAALKERLEIDPNDIPTLVMAMFVHCLRKEYGEIMQVEKRINASKRYIDQDMREKMEFVKTKCRVGATSS